MERPVRDRQTNPELPLRLSAAKGHADDATLRRQRSEMIVCPQWEPQGLPSQEILIQIKTPSSIFSRPSSTPAHRTRKNTGPQALPEVPLSPPLPVSQMDH